MDEELLNLIIQNKTLKEISEILNISLKQTYIRIKKLINYGYILDANYFYNSDINYKLRKNLMNNSSDFILNVDNSLKEVRFIVISDTHLGNLNFDTRLFYKVYDYAKKNNINIIFFIGDMLEGIHTSDKRNINNSYQQIETFIKKYPYDKDIINIGILGNHDYHFVHYDGIDVSKRINSARYDIKVIGYGQGIIRMKNDSLLLWHNLSLIKNKEPNDTKIVISGHGHTMKTKFYDRIYLCAPTLSNVTPDKTKPVVPGFMDVTVCFKKGKFDFIDAKQLIINKEIYLSSESKCMIKKLQ